ncbi:hypothetical protein MtrunA17_Chr5g0420561 [Medicago truncatula]|uniref:Uncharacterized protein n=1 Tax=Medicago truncatula TaxID=3880 RepID=A0A396HQR9_MEDTR|nr:hypothetical protein MtrunA17_Chr5g0420561 [Medicago truncatula]
MITLNYTIVLIIAIDSSIPCYMCSCPCFINLFQCINVDDMSSISIYPNTSLKGTVQSNISPCHLLAILGPRYRVGSNEVKAITRDYT